MKTIQWFVAWLSATPMLTPIDLDEEGRRLRQAASRRHADGQSHNQTKALNLIDRQESTALSMDAVEAMLRGRAKD